MNREEIKNDLFKLLIEHHGVHEEVLNEEQTIEDIGCDSLEAIELSMQVEDKFEVQIDYSEIKTTTPLSHIIDHIYQLKN